MKLRKVHPCKVSELLWLLSKFAASWISLWRQLNVKYFLFTSLCPRNGISMPQGNEQECIWLRNWLGWMTILQWLLSVDFSPVMTPQDCMQPGHSFIPTYPQHPLNWHCIIAKGAPGKNKSLLAWKVVWLLSRRKMQSAENEKAFKSLVSFSLELPGSVSK